MKLVELFSGIGSQARALSKLGINYNLINTCEWNVHAIVAYDIIHNDDNARINQVEISREEIIEKLKKMNLSFDGKIKSNDKSWSKMNLDALQRVYSSIINTNNLVNIQDVSHDSFSEEIDVLTYSFPCQDLSNVGSFHGYTKGIDRLSGSRSGLIWEVERLLFEFKENNKKLPKYLVLENVTALTSKRHKSNFEEWKSILESFGYVNKVYILNASNFGVPQNRKRLIMVSVLCNSDDEKEKTQSYFKENDLEELSKTSLNKTTKNSDLKKLLRLDYKNKTYLEEALKSQPNDTVSRKKIWENNYKIVNEKGKVELNKVATLTTKQDRHPNSGNIYFDVENKKSKFRYLTPRECFMLMGFLEKDYQRLVDKNFKTTHSNYFFTRDNMLKLAGNSIVVNVLEAVFSQIIEIDKTIFNNRINS